MKLIGGREVVEIGGSSGKLGSQPTVFVGDPYLFFIFATAGGMMMMNVLGDS